MDSPTILLIKDVPLDLTLSQIMEVNARQANFVSLVTQITNARTDITHGAISHHAIRRQRLKFQVLVKDGYNLVPQTPFVIMINVLNARIVTLLLDLQPQAEFAHRLQ